MIFDNLEPLKVWQYFDEICKIPRLSKNEDRIRNYLIELAGRYKLEYKTDKAGNLLIVKPADPGYERRKSVLLQSHMDMVGEKDASTEHNWDKDPIKPYIDGNWVRAKDTTLGADDGIGIAAQLAVLSDPGIKTGQVECLFTVDEETGMTGAIELEKNFFKSKILLNLDSEDEGELFIGCAGGIDTVAEIPYTTEPVINDSVSYSLEITGLQGGHSGDEIHKGFANSVKLMTRLLLTLTEKYGIRISYFNGGNLRNAIPREAFASVTCEKKYADSIPGEVDSFLKEVKEKYSDTEPGIIIKALKTDVPAKLIDKNTHASLLSALDKCPHGVIAWSEDMEGLVETSTNLASVKFIDDHIKIVTSQRSSVESAKKEISGRINKIFSVNNANVFHSDGYPGWKPDTNSEILAITASSYRSLFKSEPVVRAIHAGLECGLILEKYPGLDMISFGPTILGAHTPQERLDIKTTKKFWDLLVDVLKNIPES
ncbi:MAG TPA: aminoacyl-histidine dipeptidase [Bacteroidales bacterium]|nr:aminoacyl-histidine dipeptidase [Bacteroidales bacterium]